MASRREIFDRLRRTAEEVYPTAEARQIAEMITTSLGGITRNDLIIEPNKELIIDNLDTITAEIRAWRPVQYIIGHAYFAILAQFRDGVGTRRIDQHGTIGAKDVPCPCYPLPN